MQEEQTITVMAGRTQTTLEIRAIHYIQMKRNYALIHTEWGEEIRARATMNDLEAALGEDFIKVHRSCLINAAQIHHISDQIHLLSGDTLNYAGQQKESIIARVCALRGCDPGGIVHSSARPARRKKSSRKPAKAAEPPSPVIAPPVEQEETALWELPDKKYLPVMVHRKIQLIDIETILYVDSKQGITKIHTDSGTVFTTRTPLHILEETLGDSFIKIRRGCLVPVMAVHSITDKINLSNGEQLDYSGQKKKQLRNLLSSRQKLFIDSLSDEATPKTEEAYREHYRSFENLPFAFTDIEMVFNEERHAVDWIFRYGNPALARLEKMPLKKLIGSTFGSLFANMDSKWLLSYEQAVLYGRTLEITDYSPEIDTTLKVICFPTFKGHCGCFLFNLDASDGQVNALKR